MTKADTVGRPATSRRQWWVCAALFLATFAVYAQVARHEFVLLDD